VLLTGQDMVASEKCKPTFLEKSEVRTAEVRGECVKP